MKKKRRKRPRKPTNKVRGKLEKSRRALLLALRERVIALDLSVMPALVARRRRVQRPAPLNKHSSVEEKESILDYLHGDVGADEVKPCCYYEYARASHTLRKARRKYNPGRLISNQFSPWVMNPQRFCFLQCKNFPKSPWRDLTKKERENFELLFKLISPWPIITPVLKLRGIGVFDAFKEQADNALNEFDRELSRPKSEEERKKPIERVVQPAMVGVSKTHPYIKHIVITIDYRDGAPTVTEQFARWLGTKANDELFKNYHKHPKQDPESAAFYKGLLKSLAAWRLYDEFVSKLGFKAGFKAVNEWTRKNRRERADAKRGHTPKTFFWRETEQETQRQSAL